MVEHGGKSLECVLGEGKVAPVEQDCFRFPADGFEHEIRATLSQSFRRPVDQPFLFLTGAQVNRFTSPCCPWCSGPAHGHLLVDTESVHDRTHVINTGPDGKILAR